MLQRLAAIWRFKRRRREWKVRLVEELNPEWRDPTDRLVL
jgi:predicted GIY-YIG superfamily endonuclease